MKALCVHAHFDDFEFTCAGTFELWRKKLGQDFRGRILVCTDGASGHHFRTREETARMRLAEQQASARLGGLEFELLRLPDGRAFREGCLGPDVAFLAALWRAIREFEPDYLFSPPLPSDPFAGIHVDHLAVAEAVRRVGYMINLPHAFTPEYPADETQSRPCKVPFILALYDTYMGGSNAHDIAIDVEDALPLVAEMSWCHQSQIREWLPWVGRHGISGPSTKDEWTHSLRSRFAQRARELAMPSGQAFEVFMATAWGQVPTVEQLVADLPGIAPHASNLDALARKLDSWSGRRGGPVSRK